MRARTKIKALVLGLCLLLPSMAIAEVPVAVFPLQEFGEGRYDANLPFTKLIGDRLAEIGTDVIDLNTVITFMANYRIRTLGHLESMDIFRVRRELGAAFVLLGTVTERKEEPEPRLGLTLNLVRTSDARTIWSYVGAFSLGEERRVLGIGEPQTTDDLRPLVLDEIAGSWPGDRINEAQQAGLLNIETVQLTPRHIRPGDKVRGEVRLQDFWVGARKPQVFFKVRDQLYPASASENGRAYEATWVAGEESGRHNVQLHVEWPQYGRVETALLGSYLVDGSPPLLEIEFRGASTYKGLPTFDHRLVIVPRLLVRKPLARWRLAFFKGDLLIGEMDGDGNMPGSFVWSGQGSEGDGVYTVLVEAWDRAGNSAQADREVMLDRSRPEVDLAVKAEEDETVVGIDYEGKVPLRYWRLEMWTKEGKMLTKSEGRELPVEIQIEVPDTELDQEIQGFLFFQDVRGKKFREKVANLVPRPKKKPEPKEEEPTGISRDWVDEF